LLVERYSGGGTVLLVIVYFGGLSLGSNLNRRFFFAGILAKMAAEVGGGAGTEPAANAGESWADEMV
jgi:hypothetical protein